RRRDCTGVASEGRTTRVQRPEAIAHKRARDPTQSQGSRAMEGAPHRARDVRAPADDRDRRGRHGALRGGTEKIASPSTYWRPHPATFPSTIATGVKFKPARAR